jgi:hypothetical protein
MAVKKKKTALAAPDDDYCAECARHGREEPLNVTIRHSPDGLHTLCSKMRWCYVCSTGDGILVNCEGE